MNGPHVPGGPVANPTGARPSSVSQILRWVADYFDLADQAINILATNLDRPGVSGSDVQDDLRALADWFAAHHNADRLIYSELFEAVPR